MVSYNTLNLHTCTGAQCFACNPVYNGCIVLRWKVIVSQPHWSGEFKRWQVIFSQPHWSSEFKRWQVIFNQPHWSGEFKRWQVIFSQPHWSGEFKGDNLSATHAHTHCDGFNACMASIQTRLELWTLIHSLKTLSLHLHGGKQAIDWKQWLMFEDSVYTCFRTEKAMCTVQEKLTFNQA